MKIQQKFFLIQCSFSLVLLTTLVLLMQWSIGNGMVEYVNTKEIDTLSPVVTQLSKEYEKDNDWSTMAGKGDKFKRLIFNQLKESQFLRSKPSRNKNIEEPRRRKMPPPPKYLDHNAELQKRNDHPRRGPPPHQREVHHVLYDINGAHIVGDYTEDLEYTKTPILIQDNLVGYLAVPKRNQITQGYELDFIKKQQDYLWIIALVLMLLVILITLPLAHHVVTPIKLIALGMHKLTQGDYKQHIDLRRKDELGELSRDYNELALTLAENETARKRWLANISHELRTPVAILSLELEAMLDGIRPMTKENITSASDELKHLANLIDDLHQLTIADIGGMRYSKKNEDLTRLLQGEENKYQSYLADTGIAFTLNLINEPINIYCDKTRVLQLFENIINNTIKYARATQVNISSTLDNNKDEPSVLLTIEDNGIGVDETHLPNLFEYLYRTDDSRNRETGGAGLGLSICRHIVIAHQGEISAEKASLGGLAIKIKLPLA